MSFCLHPIINNDCIKIVVVVLLIFFRKYVTMNFPISSEFMIPPQLHNSHKNMHSLRAEDSQLRTCKSHPDFSIYENGTSNSNTTLNVPLHKSSYLTPPIARRKNQLDLKAQVDEDAKEDHHSIWHNFNIAEMLRKSKPEPKERFDVHNLSEEMREQLKHLYVY